MELLNSFAVVAYVGDPVARVVDSLRRELTPGCPHRAHVTVLPPRELGVETDEAIETACQIVNGFEPFKITLGPVTTFESTHVVRLCLETGLNEFYNLHDILNTGPFEKKEEYNYTPHITLCHDLSNEDCCKHLEVARNRWARYSPPPLWVDTLTFVQQGSNGTWVDLAELPLGRLQPVRVRR